MAVKPQTGTAPAPVTARLLGNSEITVGGRVLASRDWPGRKARSLFLLLLGSPGHHLHREQILDLLWPELDVEAGANALYKALHALRRVLEPDLRAGRSSAYIATRGEQTGLAPGIPLRIDLVQFDQLLARAEVAPADAQRTLVRRALDLYRGEFVADERYADWAIPRREALRADYERATLKLARLDLEAGQPLASLPYLDALVGFDPTAEAAHRAVMLAHHAGGQRSLALRQFERCREVLRREFDAEPEAATTRLADSIREAAEPFAVDLQRAASLARYASLPSLPNRTVGRTAEIAATRALLEDDGVRLVTITGPGGIGKTRLAIEVAASLLDVFPDGVGFVPLAAVRDPALLFSAIGDGLDLAEDPKRSLREVVTGFLGARRFLLVLDNLEQLVSAGRDIATLLEECPGLTILATSRVPLRIRAERLYRIGVLALPGTAVESIDDLTATDSTALFLQLMQAMHLNYEPEPPDIPAIAELCIRVDGLPLAIELAAAGCYEGTPRDVLHQLDRRTRLAVLRDGPQDLPDRHQTLFDLVSWSYDLLSEPEQRLFRRLSAFAGGVELDALVAIGGEDAIARANGLADHGLVSWTHVHGERRLTMLETIREVADRLLVDCGEDRAVRSGHAAFYAELAARVAPGLKSAGQVALLDRLGRDLHNLRSALEWSLASGATAGAALEILAGTALFWSHRGHTREFFGWLEAALGHDSTGPTPARAAAAVWAGHMARRQRDVARCRHYAEMGRVLWAELGDPAGRASVLALDASLQFDEGDYGRALETREEVLALYREAGDTWGVIDTLMDLSSTLQAHGRFDDALVSLDEALDLARQTSDLLSQSYVLAFLGGAAINAGHQDQAHKAAIEGERIARLIDNRHGLAWALWLQAAVMFYDDDSGRPVVLMRQVCELFAELNHRRNLALASKSLAACMVRAGLLAEAGAAFRAAIPLIREAGEAEGRLSTIAELGHFALATRQYLLAVQLFAASTASMAATGEHLPVPEQARLDQAVEALRSSLSPTAFGDAWSRGEDLTLDDALSLAATACEGSVTTVSAAG